ncbi:TetR/AcrR family transcriptional regulator [Halarsenatibacter silvermanii]|uniref:Transcriptional regulator, TetR family n=1 Tax=Halarsenatibacter silvermanii TaxID=321763 RepID=A0A1G9QYS1_9FIRM|nr:TetR/AcrR family transcriptional regulator [Halarsenatibacter silvermanii]SDM15737.1 transcriptional regulator, TetR family [Halarsenatibacter silvermanii]
MSSDKKDIILKAAVDIFAREGFYNTNTALITEKAGVAVGTIYNYFDSKDAILEEIFAKELEDRLQSLEKLSARSDLAAMEKLEEFLFHHFARIKNNPSLGRVLVREREFPRKKSEAIRKYFYSIPQKIEKLLVEIENESEIEIENPEISAAIIFGSIQGIMDNALRSDNLDSLDNAHSVLTSLLKKGIKK